MSRKINAFAQKYIYLETTLINTMNLENILSNISYFSIKVCARSGN